MVPAIVKVNAKSKFASGRTLSTDMSLTPLLGEIEIPTTGTNALTVPQLARESPEGKCNGARRWLTKD
jgi:hypothetical protein